MYKVFKNYILMYCLLTIFPFIAEVDSEVSSRNDDDKSEDVDDQRDSSSSDKTEQKKRN